MIYSDFQPTIMQKLLGRNYKWLYIMSYNFRLAQNDVASLIITIVRFTIPLLVSLLIYSSFAETKNLTGELALANYFFQFSVIAYGIGWDLRFNVIKGGLSNKLLVPTDYITSQFCVALGFNSFVFFLRTITLLPVLIFTKSPILFTPWVLPTLALLILSFVSFMFLEIIIGSTAFWLNAASNRILEMYGEIVPILSGALIIFSINPITQTFVYNPISLAAYHPMQVYLGKYSIDQTLIVFTCSMTWCIVLYFLAKWIFKLGLKRNEAVGL